MIYLLFIISASILWFAYRYCRLKLLSPTLWTSAMFSFFSLIYGITIFDMNNDISILTVCVVSAFLLLTLFGETLGTKITINFARRRSILSYSIEGERIYVKKSIAFLLTVIFLIVAANRYLNMRAYVIQNGGQFNNIIDMMEAARVIFVRTRREMVIGNTFTNQMVYCCEICAYIFLYIFIHNCITCKVRDFYLLLVLIPDIIIRFLSTSRTSFMILAVAAAVSYISVMQQKSMKPKIHISKKVYLAIILFAIAFIVYGRVRNKATSIPIVDYVQMYTCSSIYGLDHLLVNGWVGNPYFGMHTLQHIYELIGIDMVPVKTWNVMLDFNAYHSHANVYTSLMGPISDYGIIITMLLRFITAFVSAYIIKRYISIEHNRTLFYVMHFFVVMFIYCYFYSATGDVFCDVFLNPGLMIRYLAYTCILVKWIIRPKVRELHSIKGIE